MQDATLQEDPGVTSERCAGRHPGSEWRPPEDFATFRGPAYLMDMGTETLPVTAGSFEKVFTALATKRPYTRRRGSTLTDWREIAWAALEGKKLGDTLRRAIETLSIKYREVLFLQDVKNLSTAETAWVLNITVGAVRYRLLRARMRVHDTLTARLLAKLSQRNSNLANSYAHDIPYKIQVLGRQHSFSLT